MTGKNDTTVMAEGMKEPVTLEEPGNPFPYDDHLQTHWAGHPEYGIHEDEKCSDAESEDDQVYPGSAATDDESSDDEEASDPGSVQDDEAPGPAADLELGAEGWQADLADARHIQFYYFCLFHKNPKNASP